ncbi:MAG: hypothetical protein A2901_03420 [Elusimicrobia bacterium RIFCSPLOWO2_01_FULL_54_10]|nr:MAG: hypothetical protein A2901_03420 [Elusimicrobia bacterium RIFCSPLOWO2_01_FULL_54_10]
MKKAQVAEKKVPQKKAKEYVIIDHPSSGEILTASHYAVRIGASSEGSAVSIDGSAWVDCRPANGYFWFDWTEITPGAHALTARILSADGKIKKSKVVKCSKA